MKRKGIFRCISLLLAVIVLITSVPQNTYAETARIDDEATTSACLENEDSLVTPLDKGVSEPETVSESGENESTDENTSKSEDGESADENISENSAESEQSTDSLEDTYSEIDSVLDEEDMEVENVTLLDAAEGSTLTISESLESVSNPEKGYEWNKSTHTLTLNGANLEKLTISCNSTVVVEGDSTIENSASNALNVSGVAENVTITGTGELKLISHGSTFTFGMNNDSKSHTITVSGALLTVNCVNDSTREAVFVKGNMNVIDGATLKATTSGNYGIYTIGSFKVTNGAKVITDTPKNERAIYLSGNNTSLIVSGEGSCLTSNKSEKEGLSKPVIATEGTYDYSIEIKDGGKLTANDISDNCLISSSTATVDLRGGKIEVHAKEGEEFNAGSSMIYAKKIMCNEDGLTNAKLDEDGNIVMAVKSDTWSYEYAGLDFTTVPDAIDCSYDNFSGVLRLNPRANIVPGMTYKVAVTDNLTAYGTNIYTTNYVTVKALKSGKSGKTDITVKTSTKGKIDMSRPDSTMQVINTYNGWNSEVAIAEGNPVVSFEVYAYDKKNKPYKCEETGYQHSGDSGLVAKGDSSGYAATSLDWFKDVDASQYGISLQLNPENPAVTKLTAADGFYDLTYKIVVKTTFVKYISSTENMTLTGETKFTLIAGTVKLAAPSPNKVTLNSKNRFDSKIVKIKLTDNDAASIDITEVSSVNNLYYDATLIKVKDGYAYVAIGWKDDLVSVNHKNGKMTLDFYAGYNSIDRGKKNATAAVTVEAR